MKSTSFSAFDGSPFIDDLTPHCPVGATTTRVAQALQLRRDPGDWAFDRFMPRSLALASERFWTPLVVATRVAHWLDDFDIETVVDIGSGAGKFCIATALAGGCAFVGVEQRPRLVRAARHMARLFRVEDRVHFLHGAFGDEAPPFADAYYLYNPFGENLFPLGDHLDDDVELGEDRFRRDVTTVEAFLARARVGTFVVTYNEFGGAVPRSYEVLREDNDLPNVLRLSRKTR